MSSILRIIQSLQQNKREAENLMVLLAGLEKERHHLLDLLDKVRIEEYNEGAGHE